MPNTDLKDSVMDKKKSGKKKKTRRRSSLNASLRLAARMLPLVKTVKRRRRASQERDQPKKKKLVKKIKKEQQERKLSKKRLKIEKRKPKTEIIEEKKEKRVKKEEPEKLPKIETKMIEEEEEGESESEEEICIIEENEGPKIKEEEIIEEKEVIIEVTEKKIEEEEEIEGENEEEETEDIGTPESITNEQWKKMGVEEVEGDTEEEEEEIEGEVEEEEEEKEKLDVDSDFADKVKDNVVHLLEKFAKSKNRKKFRKKIEKEIKKNCKVYNICSDVCMMGVDKLIKASKNYVKALDLSIKTLKNVMKRVKQLKKFTIEICAVDIRIRKLSDFVSKMERGEERLDSDNLVFTFNEIHQVHDTLEKLLRNISEFSKGVKVRRALLKGVVGTGLVSGVGVSCGGLVVTGIGGVAAVGVLLTSAVSWPVAVVLLALCGVGAVGGLGAAVLGLGSCFILLNAAAVEQVSSKLSLRRAKKLRKKVNKMKKKKCMIWKDIMKLMENVRQAEMDRLKARNNMSTILENLMKEIGDEIEEEKKKKIEEEEEKKE